MRDEDELRWPNTWEKMMQTTQETSNDVNSVHRLFYYMTLTAWFLPYISYNLTVHIEIITLITTDKLLLNIM